MKKVYFPKKQSTNRGLLYPKGSELTIAQNEVLKLITDEHLTLKQIQLRRKCTKQAVYKILRAIKEKGYLNNGLLSQGTSQPKGIISHGKVRLHGQEFNIKLIFQDHRYQNLLSKSNLMYLEGHTIKLFKNSLEIYSGEGISFLGDSEQEADSKSVEYWKKFFTKLETELKVILIKNRVRNIKEVNHHYARTNSDICKNAIENKELIRVFAIEDGKLAFITDDSFGLREDETLHPITAKIDRGNLDKQLNDWRLNNPPTNSELATLSKQSFELINGIAKNQIIFDKNMSSHLEVLNKIGDAITELRHEIKKLNNKEFKGGNQKSLFDF